MGVAATHYVVLGVSITDEAQVKEFFRINEEHFEFMEGYDDNAYDQNITPSESGIHVIVDGMSGKYVVVGKILAKAIDNGFDGLDLIEVADISTQYRNFYPEVLKLDRELETKFGGLDAKVIVFTHWH
jgi:hypothetical protein